MKTFVDRTNVAYYSESDFIHEDNTVFHGFFTRLGGVSSAPCAGLNCGFGSDDEPANIKDNRDFVAKAAGVRPAHLLSPYQVHGADVYNVDALWDERPHADALVTDRAGFALGILTADCGPVLFSGEKESGAPVIGAAHAGWKGALGGVLENTITQMLSLGCIKDTIKACVGPCIGRNSYEVSHAFITPFIDEAEESERFFSAASREGHAMFDLSGYCAWRISRAGGKQVSLLDLDTYKNAREFFSYRRATHNNEADYGRQISVISIKDE